MRPILSLKVRPICMRISKIFNSKSVALLESLFKTPLIFHIRPGPVFTCSFWRSYYTPRMLQRKIFKYSVRVFGWFGVGGSLNAYSKCYHSATKGRGRKSEIAVSPFGCLAAVEVVPRRRRAWPETAPLQGAIALH